MDDGSGVTNATILLVFDVTTTGRGKGRGAEEVPLHTSPYVVQLDLEHLRPKTNFPCKTCGDGRYDMNVLWRSQLRPNEELTPNALGTVPLDTRRLPYQALGRSP